MAPQTSGAGMSRAAKKRAKKRQKQQLHQTHEPDDDEPEPAPTHPSSRQSHKKLKTDPAGTKDLLPDDDSEVEEEILSAGEDDSSAEGGDHAVAVRALARRVPTAARVPPGVTGLVQLMEDGDAMEMTASDRAKCLLSFLMNMPLEEFYKQYFEKKPLLVQTMKNRTRLDGLLNLSGIRTMVQSHKLYYGQDLNVTRYQMHKDGVKRRVTMDPSAKGDQAKPVDSSIWSDFYQNGCTIRLLCPQKHNDSIFKLLSYLETEFGCMVGSNAYLTPPDGSQGFAPHYDDIDAFCLQLEGKKRWKVYAPLNKKERLPRVSSEDFTAADLDGVDPVLDIVLEKGDVLYMPRGWIHQACTLPENELAVNEKQDQGHSLHLTISTMQQWAWIDLMEIIVPEALQAVATGDSAVLREGLPLQFLEYMGAMHDASDSAVPDVLKKGMDDSVDSAVEEKKMKKDEFLLRVKKRLSLVMKEATNLIDAACDQLGVRFLSERLPPALSAREKLETEGGRSDSLKLLPNMMCRIARPGIARLVIEEGKAVLYHCNDNSRVYMERALNPLEFELDDAPAIEQLLTTTEPRWIMVADLFHDTIEDKVGVAQALFDEGLLAVHEN